MDQEKPVLNIGEQAKAYVETKMQIIRLNAIQKGAHILAESATRMALVQFLLFTILFAGFAAAAWIKQATGNETLGYAITGLFFLVVTLIYLLLRRGFNRRLEDRFISKMSADETDQE